jgi:glycosyltransferase involved in cell wall biosynthesis
VKHVNLYGPINQLGFGQHFSGWAGHLLPLLKDNGFSTAVLPTDFSVPKGTLSPHMTGLMAAATQPTAFEPGGASIYLGNLNEVHSYTGAPRIHYIVFEGTKLNEKQRSNARKVDYIIVPTRWAQDVLRSNGVQTRVFKVPEGIDPTVFHPGDTGQRSVYGWVEDPEEMLTFVSVGKLEMRKGMQTALDAFVPAHRSTGRPMRILAHWFNLFIRNVRGELIWTAPADRLIRSRGFMPAKPIEVSVASGDTVVRYTHTNYPNLHVDLITHFLPTQEELVQVYRAGDFGLFPHFAEGWGLPLQESMACGLPPITQNYSGPTEYLPDDLDQKDRPAYIPLEGVPALAKDGSPKDNTPSFFQGDVGTWSQVTTNSCTRAFMTAAAMSVEDRKSMGAAAADRAGEYTWGYAAFQTLLALKEMGIS